MDLSIPQNIAPDLVASNQVKYVNIDSLRTLADENLKARSQCISEAKKIIDHYVGEFESMYEQRKIERALAGLSQQISQVKSRALSKVFKYRIEELPEESRQLIEEITDYMAKKCVAVPMKLAKEQLISKSE